MNTSIQPYIESLEIIYEDEYIIAVNKPNNYLVHHSDYARNLEDEKTLIDLLNAQGFENCYPIHRLDRKTSGIILLAKQKEYVAQFQDLFTNNNIQKTYYSISRGFAPNTGIIDHPIKIDETNKTKTALTHFKTIHQIELPIPVHPYNKSRYSLIELQPKTGRMHQLRKHLNKISHPIVGDYKYGDRFHNRMFETEFECIYMFLHAYSLEFTHPISNKKLIFKAKFPSDWEKLFTKFSWNT
ncbi:MAG: pseudouridine synthase [Vicingaceae bacterium]